MNLDLGQKSALIVGWVLISLELIRNAVLGAAALLPILVPQPASPDHRQINRREHVLREKHRINQNTSSSN